LLSENNKLKIQPSDCFLLGMFSLIDALIDRPMKEIVTELPIDEEIRQALLGQPNRFYDLLQLVVSYEKGFWEDLPVYAKKLNIREEDLPDMYMEAVTWSHKMV
jgi:c-di-GMP-related signal transduction protein